MKKNEFEKIKDKSKYQVFCFSSPVPFPLCFAVHTWFVINLKGKIHRIEFGKFMVSENEKRVKTGVFKDFIRPTNGMNKYFWKPKPRFKSKLIGVVEGGENSIAKKMTVFIKNKSSEYPLKDKYSLIGPNSNTFTQWILDKFHESDLKLPFNAFGKRYKFK